MTRKSFSLAELLILLGSSVFMFVLWLSAYLEKDIRWLHFFQAWMYVVAVVLSLRHNLWGYLIGFSAAAFWDYLNLFVTTFLRSGLRWTGEWISTGELKRLDQIVAVPGWIGNFLVVVGAVWAYTRLTEKGWSDLGRLAVAIVGTAGFFAAAMALCQPRYLPLFKAMLHPHSPW